MSVLVTVILNLLTLHSCLHVSNNARSSSSTSPLVSCSPNGQQIPRIFKCDGIIDCKNSRDESNEDCAETINQTFSDSEIRMLNTIGYKLPDQDRYKTFWETYKPKLVDLPYVGSSVASVDIYYLQSPVFHDNNLNPLLSWLLLKQMRSIDLMHTGVGMLMRDKKGKELSRVSIQFWSANTAMPDNPSMLRNKTLTYDEEGRLLFEGRSILTYSRSRGNWEGGYWTDTMFLKSLNNTEYQNKLLWINDFLVKHQQFTWSGVQDREGNELMPKHDCDYFSREMVKAFTGIDVFQIPDQAITYTLPYLLVDVIERNVPSSRVQKLVGDASPRQLIGYSPLDFVLQAFRTYICASDVFQPYHAVMKRFCTRVEWNIDPRSMLVTPVFHNTAGGTHSDSDEFASNVHITLPTGEVILKESTKGLEVQMNNLFWEILLLAVLNIPPWLISPDLMRWIIIVLSTALGFSVFKVVLNAHAHKQRRSTKSTVDE